MGGNILKHWNLPEKRLNPQQYESISHFLLKKFSTDGKCLIGIPYSIRNKETHGDLDIICSDLSENKLWKSMTFPKYIEKEFGYVPKVNTNVISFPYNEFQIDVTFVEEKNFQSSINYCSWNDTSMLVGRIFHKMGLHFGHTGLSFWIRQGLFDNNLNWTDNDHIYEKFVISQNHEEILQLGGFDYNVWKNGFDTEEDAFQFVISGDYFDPSLFALENLNHINRVRNKKRGMYMRFVEYITDKGFSPKKSFLTKENYALIFQQRFPQLREAIDEYRFQNSIKNCIKAKINGNLIKEMFPDLEGQQIGKVLSFIKGNYSDADLLKMSETHAKNIIESACISIVEM